jgi:hypothetical protein
MRRMGTTVLARFGLMPILVLLLVAPPRVCTCEHSHVPTTQMADPDDDGDDQPAHHHHNSCPAGDQDCPFVQPPQMKATVSAGPVMVATPAAFLTFAARDNVHIHLHRPKSDIGTGDPPLYLTGCALRF